MTQRLLQPANRVGLLRKGPPFHQQSAKNRY
jgi:hypothetical protein